MPIVSNACVGSECKGQSLAAMDGCFFHHHVPPQTCTTWAGAPLLGRTANSCSADVAAPLAGGEGEGSGGDARLGGSCSRASDSLIKCTPFQSAPLCQGACAQHRLQTRAASLAWDGSQLRPSKSSRLKPPCCGGSACCGGSRKPPSAAAGVAGDSGAADAGVGAVPAVDLMDPASDAGAGGWAAASRCAAALAAVAAAAASRSAAAAAASASSAARLRVRFSCRDSLSSGSRREPYAAGCGSARAARADACAVLPAVAHAAL